MKPQVNSKLKIAAVPAIHALSRSSVCLLSHQSLTHPRTPMANSSSFGMLNLLEKFVLSLEPSFRVDAVRRTLGHHSRMSSHSNLPQCPSEEHPTLLQPKSWQQKSMANLAKAQNHSSRETKQCNHKITSMPNHSSTNDKWLTRFAQILQSTPPTST